jgi:hypothetical protein
MSTYLIKKSELQNNQGLHQIITNTEEWVKFEANDSQFDQLNPMPAFNSFEKCDSDGNIIIPKEKL